MPKVLGIETWIVLDNAPIHRYVVADKGYDADAFVLLIKQSNAEVVIPSKVNRKIQRVIDTQLYKERH